MRPPVYKVGKAYWLITFFYREILFIQDFGTVAVRNIFPDFFHNERRFFLWSQTRFYDTLKLCNDDKNNMKNVETVILSVILHFLLSKIWHFSTLLVIHWCTSDTVDTNTSSITGTLHRFYKNYFYKNHQPHFMGKILGKSVKIMLPDSVFLWKWFSILRETF